MKSPAKLFVSCFVFVLIGLGVFIFFKTTVKAVSSRPVDATVKTSICGNLLKESGEDCDNTDLGGKSCINLGFSGGDLSCDIGCSFETSICTVPVINPAKVAPSDVISLVAAGYFSVPGSASIISTPTLVTVTNIAVVIPVSGGVSKVVIPANTVIVRVDGDYINPTVLTVAPIVTSQVSGLTGKEAKAVLQWGLADATLDFSDPITIDVYVGTDLNGDTLNIVRSAALTEGWTSDGIVSPATCVVSNGVCTFQATKASYFAAVKEILTPAPTATPTPSSSSSTSTTSSSGSSSKKITLVPILETIINLFKLPKAVLVFDTNGDGKITKDELTVAASLWVKSWTNYLNSGFSETKNCDINSDNVCDLKDFSILLFYTS
jgi:hypothetical protein